MQKITHDVRVSFVQPNSGMMRYVVHKLVTKRLLYLRLRPRMRAGRGSKGNFVYPELSLAPVVISEINTRIVFNFYLLSVQFEPRWDLHPFLTCNLNNNATPAGFTALTAITFHTTPTMVRESPGTGVAWSAATIASRSPD